MEEIKEEIIGGKKRHFTVGAIIEKGGKDDALLMIDRKKMPFGWACPAGHIDKGETSKEALKREVKEETGLDIIKYKLVAEEFLPWNECSYRIKGHYWYVYTCTVKGSLKICAEEAKSWGWVDKTNLRNLALEPVWEHWFNKLGII